MNKINEHLYKILSLKPSHKLINIDAKSLEFIEILLAQRLGVVAR